MAKSRLKVRAEAAAAALADRLADVLAEAISDIVASALRGRDVAHLQSFEERDDVLNTSLTDPQLGVDVIVTSLPVATRRS